MIDLHARFNALLPAYIADALSEADHVWMDRHRAECVECSGLFARLEARLPELRDHAGHAPVSVLVDLAWADSPLTALERRLVLQHLAQCAACRTEADTLGYRAPAAMQRTGVWMWRTGLAAAAALALFVAIRREPPTPPTLPTPVPVSPSTPATGGTTTRVDLVEVTRGNPMSSSAGTVDSTTRTLEIALPFLFFADSSDVAIRLMNERGVRWHRDTVPQSGLRKPLRIQASDSSWPPGAYRLEVIPDAGRDTLATRTFSFRLANRRP